MVKIKFRFKDEYSRGEWVYREYVGKDWYDCYTRYHLDEVTYEKLSEEEYDGE